MSAPPVMWFSTSRTVHALARRRVVELCRARSVDDPGGLAEHLVDHRDLVHDVHLRPSQASSGSTRLIRRRRPGGSVRRPASDPGRARPGRPASQLCSSSVHRRGDAVEAAEQHDLAVEVVGLDRDGPAGQALPRRRRPGGDRPPRRPIGTASPRRAASSSGRRASMPAAARHAVALVPAPARLRGARRSGPHSASTALLRLFRSLRVLPAHDVGARDRLEGRRRRAPPRSPRHVASAPFGIAADVEHAGDAARRRPRPTPGSRCSAGHTTHTPYTSAKQRSAARSLATPFCTHTTAIVDGRDRGQRASRRSPVCWLFIASSTTSSARKSIPAGCDDHRVDSVTVPRRARRGAGHRRGWRRSARHARSAPPRGRVEAAARPRPRRSRLRRTPRTA